MKNCTTKFLSILTLLTGFVCTPGSHILLIFFYSMIYPITHSKNRHSNRSSTPWTFGLSLCLYLVPFSPKIWIWIHLHIMLLPVCCGVSIPP